ASSASPSLWCSSSCSSCRRSCDGSRTAQDGPVSLRNGVERSSPGSLAAPDGRLAVAAIEEPAAGGLHPLGAARPALAGAGEGPGDPTNVDAGLGAVGRRDLDRGVAALTLARVNPAGVAPAWILCRTCHRRRGEQRQDGENRVTHARAHPRWSLPVRDSTRRRPFGTIVL